MGFTDWLFSGIKDAQYVRAQDDAAQEPSNILLQSLIEGEKITREQALSLPSVSGAVNLIADAIAAMPVRLYKRTTGGVIEITDDVRTLKLNGDTGDTLDGFQLKHAMVQDYLMGKGGYCFISRKRNLVKGLHYVKDRDITIQENFQPIFKDYQIYVLGEIYEPHNFIKVLRNTENGAEGVGLTAEVGKTLEAAYSTLLYQLNLVRTGGNKKGFLKSEYKLTDQALEVLRQAFKRLYTSSTENIIVLNKGVDFQEASNSAVENQINESRNTLAREIADLFHISDDFLTTFKLAIYPVMKAFETALNRDLLLESEKHELYFAFDPKEVLRVSVKERYEAYKLAKDTGFMTLNEIRAAENMDTIDGLDVINVGLAAVLYDTDTHTYYTPNTGDKTNINDTIDSVLGG